MINSGNPSRITVPIPLPLLLLCFSLSGMSSLMLELVWIRQLTLLFGNTLFSSSTVFAVFMGGLALGAALAGRWTDRHTNPLAGYALLEILIGLYALASPLLIGQLYDLVPVIRQGSGLPNLITLLLTTAVLLPPTIMMGATLPLVTTALTPRHQDLGTQLGRLYGLNTLGGVLGILLAGLVLFQWWGIKSTLVLAAAIDLAIGLGIGVYCYRMPQAFKQAKPAGAARQVPRMTAVVVLLMGGYALAGSLALGLEVAWSRMFALLLGSSTYALSAVLAVFLTGLATGSWQASRRIQRWEQTGRMWSRLATFQAVLGLYAGLAVLVVEFFPGWLIAAFQWSQGRFWLYMVLQLLLVAAFTLPPTLLMGASFPVVGRLYALHRRLVGSSVGDTYWFNTAGAVVGSLLTGFILLPLLGLQTTITLLAAGYLLLSAVFLLGDSAQSRRRLALRAVPALLACALLFTLPPWNLAMVQSGIYAKIATVASGNLWERTKEQLRSEELLFYKEGTTAAVKVSQQGSIRTLRINGKADASTGIMDMETQLLSGHLPLLLSPQARTALVVGLGSGITTGALTRYPLDQIDVVEIEPAVAEAARWFAEANGNLLQDPRVNLHFSDARNFVLGVKQRYDVITAEPSNPWIAGISNLFTSEQFQAYRRLLNPGGTVVQWIHSYNMKDTDLQMIIGTFQAAFPYTTLWSNLWGTDLFLLGTLEPQKIDYSQLTQRLAIPAVASDLAQVAMDSPATLLGYYVAGSEQLAAYASQAPRNTDDLPHLEFSAPRNLLVNTTAANLELLLQLRLQTTLPPSMALPPVISARQAIDSFLQAELAMSQSNPARAFQLYLEAVQANPLHRPLAQHAVTVYTTRGNNLYNRQQYQSALPEFERAVALNPQDIPAWWRLATVQAQLGDPDGYFHSLLQLLQLDPDDEDIHLSLAAQFYLQDDHEAALEHLNRALQINPNKPEALQLLSFLESQGISLPRQ